MALDYFPWYHSYLKKCEKLTDQELGRLVRALMKYSVTGERQELAGRESIAFDFIADDIDRAKKAYEEKCRTNRENGRKANATDRGRTVANAPQSKNKSKSEDESKDITTTTERVRDDGLGRVMDTYMDKICPTPSQTSMDELKAYVETMGAEVCLRAINDAIDSGPDKTNWRFIHWKLQNWQSLGVRCEADIERLDKKPGKGGKPNGNQNSAGSGGNAWNLTAVDL